MAQFGLHWPWGGIGGRGPRQQFDFSADVQSFARHQCDRLPAGGVRLAACRPGGSLGASVGHRDFWADDHHECTPPEPSAWATNVLWGQPCIRLVVVTLCVWPRPWAHWARVREPSSSKVADFPGRSKVKRVPGHGTGGVSSPAGSRRSGR